MTDKTPVSLKQLAKMAGVSTATVSRVINDNGRFSEDTREKVLALIKKTGYVPNIAAKALRTRTARAVGLVIPDIANEFFSLIVDSMGKFFFDSDYSLFVCNTCESLDKNRAQIRNLLGKGVDGLIYISRFPLDARDIPVPVVYLDRVTGESDGCSMVSSDNHQGGRLAARALLDAGTRKPAMLCAPEDLDGLSTISGRIAGFAEVMRENGVKWSRKDIVVTRMSVPEARRNVARAFKRNRRFDGLFSTLDLGAIGAIFGLEDAGLRVPRDVNVVGFDDISFCEYCKPALTTVRQDTVALANTAARMLFSDMENRAARGRHVQVPVTLVVRDSTRRAK